MTVQCIRCWCDISKILWPVYEVSQLNPRPSSVTSIIHIFFACSIWNPFLCSARNIVHYMWICIFFLLCLRIFSHSFRLTEMHITYRFHTGLRFITAFPFFFRLLQKLKRYKLYSSLWQFNSHWNRTFNRVTKSNCWNGNCSDFAEYKMQFWSLKVCFEKMVFMEKNDFFG